MQTTKFIFASVLGGAYALGLSLAHWKITRYWEYVEYQKELEQIYQCVEKAEKEGKYIKGIWHRGNNISVDETGNYTVAWRGNSMVLYKSRS
jgi:hypothetical protein